MGFVEIPKQVRVGRSSARIELDTIELRVLLERLKEVVTEYGSREPQPLRAAADPTPPPSPPQHHPPGGPRPAHMERVITPPAARPATASPPPIPLASTDAAHAPSVRAVPGPALSRPQPAPPCPEPVEPAPPHLSPTQARPAGRWPDRKAAEVGNRPGSAVSLVDVESPEAAMAVASPGRQWRRCWATDPGDHEGLAVTAVAYAASFEGLAGGDGHGGWCISASKNLLNLWECNAGGGRTEPSLQVMHSQATEYQIWALDLNRKAQVLIAAATHPHDGALCVAVYSLASDNFLAHKGIIRVKPGVSVAALRRRQAAARVPGPLLRLCSLQPLGGPLENTLAAAVDTDVFVHDLSAVSTAPALQPATPRATWRSHDAPVTAIHRSSFAINLFTGAGDGSIRLWDLRSRPSAPVIELCHGRLPVTALSLVDAHSLASTGTDGAVNLWDLRGTAVAGAAAPRQTFSPDGGAVVAAAPSPLRDMIAMATAKGVWCLELQGDGGAPVCSALDTLTDASQSRALVWNERTGEVYASTAHGALNVYNKSY